jgi:phosphatidylinositol kinase/protein kinase (PI-3  family)
MQTISQGCVLIEFLEGTRTIADIKRQHGSILKYFSREFLHDLALIKDNFVRSLAGYCVFSHFAQVKDRHNSNIMVDS